MRLFDPYRTPAAPLGFRQWWAPMALLPVMATAMVCAGTPATLVCAAVVLGVLLDFLIFIRRRNASWLARYPVTHTQGGSPARGVPPGTGTNRVFDAEHKG
jgi:hypothetical protein